MRRPLRTWGHFLDIRDHKALNLSDDMRASGLTEDQMERALAEATHDRRRQEWIERTGLKETSSSHKCARRLLLASPRCRGECLRPPGADHDSLWLLGGKPTLYVTQPYDLEVHKLVAWCEAHGLLARVDLWPAWHFPGRVFHVGIATAEAWGRIDAERHRIFELRHPRKELPK